mmetsp:Transcript_44985/g.101870  ORF Transcript_44985/g.101870 Transcript_44985/m.101870 type:complete len:221 (-) Transcript_44985:1462-2124(-)
MDLADLGSSSGLVHAIRNDDETMHSMITWSNLWFFAIDRQRDLRNPSGSNRSKALVDERSPKIVCFRKATGDLCVALGLSGCTRTSPSSLSVSCDPPIDSCSTATAATEPRARARFNAKPAKSFGLFGKKEDLIVAIAFSFSRIVVLDSSNFAIIMATNRFNTTKLPRTTTKKKKTTEAGPTALIPSYITTFQFSPERMWYIVIKPQRNESKCARGVQPY